MSDEEALLLTLLDRPHDPAVRLVYADWLEDHGEDDLAEWLRLHTAARPAYRQRLRELRERHRHDWVDLHGVTLRWDGVLAVLRRRLADVVAWCTRREYKVLRTPELMPHLHNGASSIESLWHCRRPEERTALVHRLGNLRAARLDAFGLAPEETATDLAGGRLVLFAPDRAHGDGAARLNSGGYFDAYQAPAWDTWLFYFDEGAAGRRRAHTHWEHEWILRRKVLPVAFASYLVAWVPPALVRAVDRARDVPGVPCLEWAENVECDLTVRLRELGWLHAPERERALARTEQRIGQRG
jgi:uncharacterized protein (TIGR02996 family)